MSLQKDLNDKLLIESSKLTKKQRAFFNYIGLGYSRTEAARKAHYKEPRASGRDILQSHTQAFREVFEKLGLGLTDIAEQVKEGTKADRTISANVIVKSDDPVVRDRKANGLTVDFIDVPDWNARHKFIDTSIELQGLYAPDKHEISGEDGGPIELVGKNVIYLSHIDYGGKAPAPTAPSNPKGKKVKKK